MYRYTHVWFHRATIQFSATHSIWEPIGFRVLQKSVLSCTPTLTMHKQGTVDVDDSPLICVLAPKPQTVNLPNPSKPISESKHYAVYSTVDHWKILLIMTGIRERGLYWQGLLTVPHTAVTQTPEPERVCTSQKLRDHIYRPWTAWPYFGVLTKRILLFRVVYWGPLFSETPVSGSGFSPPNRGLPS